MTGADVRVYFVAGFGDEILKASALERRESLAPGVLAEESDLDTLVSSIRSRFGDASRSRFHGESLLIGLRSGGERRG